MLHKRLSPTATQAAWAKDKRSTRMRAEACAIDKDDDDEEEGEACEGERRIALSIVEGMRVLFGHYSKGRLTWVPKSQT